MQDPVLHFIREFKFDGNADWNALLPTVYASLRELAAVAISSQRGPCTLEPTALAHEAWERLASNKSFESREHFLAVAAVAIRGILVDHARARAAAKRGGDWQRITLSAGDVERNSSALDLVDLDDILQQLNALDSRRARVVELRVFGGLTQIEIAKVLGVSLSSVEADWRLARAWLSARFADRGTP